MFRVVRRPQITRSVSIFFRESHGSRKTVVGCTDHPHTYLPTPSPPSPRTTQQKKTKQNKTHTHAHFHTQPKLTDTQQKTQTTPPLLPQNTLHTSTQNAIPILYWYIHTTSRTRSYTTRRTQLFNTKQNKTKHTHRKANKQTPVGGVSIRSRNGAPSRKGCLVNGQMTKASNKMSTPPHITYNPRTALSSP